MTSAGLFAPRDIVIADIEGVEEDKWRPAVVTCAGSDFIELIYGQGKRNPQVRDIEILPDSIDGKRFGITKSTYFRLTNVVLVLPVRIKRKVGICRLDKFPEFMALAECARAAGAVSRIGQIA